MWTALQVIRFVTGVDRIAEFADAWLIEWGTHWGFGLNLLECVHGLTLRTKETLAVES